MSLGIPDSGAAFLPPFVLQEDPRYFDAINEVQTRWTSFMELPGNQILKPHTTLTFMNSIMDNGLIKMNFQLSIAIHKISPSSEFVVNGSEIVKQFSLYDPSYLSSIVTLDTKTDFILTITKNPFAFSKVKRYGCMGAFAFIIVLIAIFLGLLFVDRQPTLVHAMNSVMNKMTGNPDS